jgi:hypothetical protein
MVQIIWNTIFHLHIGSMGIHQKRNYNLGKNIAAFFISIIESSAQYFYNRSSQIFLEILEISHN